jgi:hypothetical protein
VWSGGVMNKEESEETRKLFNRLYPFGFAEESDK